MQAHIMCISEVCLYFCIRQTQCISLWQLTEAAKNEPKLVRFVNWKRPLCWSLWFTLFNGLSVLHPHSNKAVNNWIATCGSVPTNNVIFIITFYIFICNPRSKVTHFATSTIIIFHEDTLILMIPTLHKSSRTKQDWQHNNIFFGD